MTIELFFSSNRSPSIDPWDEGFVYLDEQHPNPVDTSFAVGMLMTPVPVPPTVVSDALAALAPGDNVKRRGYFHAKDDGRSAQTALANAIGNHLPAAQFEAFRWTPERAQSRHQDLSFKDRHNHVAALVVGHACAVVRSAVHVEFASGPSIALPAFEQWMHQQTEVRLQTMILQGGAIPMRFPLITIQESTPARSPGIQAVDLLLWHHRRLRARKKAPCRNLFERALLEQVMRWNPEEGPMEKATFGRNVPLALAYRPSGKSAGNWDRWGTLLVCVEILVHRVAAMAAPLRHIEHLMPRVCAASRSLIGYLGADFDSLREFLRVFLLLADTLPIYVDDPGFRQEAADMIRVATSMDDLRLVKTIVSMDRWSAIRRNNRALLGWEVGSGAS